jgi:hypothetical protein
LDKDTLDLVQMGGEEILAALAFVSIIVTQIVTTKLNSMKIQTLADHVKEQNGTLAVQARELHSMQIVCAETHGIRQPPPFSGPPNVEGT